MTQGKKFYTGGFDSSSDPRRKSPSHIAKMKNSTNLSISMYESEKVVF